MYDVKRFSSIFKGLTEAYGIWHTDPLKRKTVRKPATDQMFEDHLVGKIHLGICPISSENACVFGAIDIDIEVDTEKIAREISAYDLPLIACRSKSGGAHLYTFKEKPVSAKVMRANLKHYAEILGCSKSEIFPKQDVLVEGSLGNWINLPYQNAAKTNRYAYFNGSMQDLEGFMDAVETIKKHRQKDKAVLHRLPPCLAHLLIDGCPSGGRNQSLYQFGVFYKKSQPDAWEDRIQEINFKVMNPPLPQIEVKNIVSSLSKKDYGYKCEEVPMCDICQKDICASVPFGVAGVASEDMKIGSIRKIVGDKIKWEMEVNKQIIELESGELMDFRYCRVKLMECTDRILPMMKQEIWEEFVNEKLKEVIIRELPESARESGGVYGEVCQWARHSVNSENLIDLMRDMPIVGMVENAKSLIFKPRDMIRYFKQMKYSMDEKMAWNSLSKYGIKCSTIAIKTRKITIWSLPWNENEMGMVEMPSFTETNDDHVKL
jgi:hypothetical protein